MVGEMTLRVTHVTSGDSFFAVAADDLSMLRRVETALRQLPARNDAPLLVAARGSVVAVQRAGVRERG